MFLSWIWCQKVHTFFTVLASNLMTPKSAVLLPKEEEEVTGFCIVYGYTIWDRELCTGSELNESNSS
jgi:hypothetical protein